MFATASLSSANHYKLAFLLHAYHSYYFLNKKPCYHPTLGMNMTAKAFKMRARSHIQLTELKNYCIRRYRVALSSSNLFLRVAQVVYIHNSPQTTYWS
uniref:Uncharacterized protein n=1 Tax=Ciona intestinalis TaxID=7719 RepID=H2XLV1_CIOIN